MASWLMERAPTWTYNPPKPEKIPEEQTGWDFNTFNIENGGWSGYRSSGTLIYGTQIFNEVRWNVDPVYNSGIFYIQRVTYYSQTMGGDMSSEVFVAKRIPHLCGNQISHNMLVRMELADGSTYSGWSPLHTWNFPIPYDSDGPRWLNGWAGNHASASTWPLRPVNDVLDNSHCGPILIYDPIFLDEGTIKEIYGLAVRLNDTLWYTFLTSCGHDPIACYRFLELLPKEKVFIGYARHVPPFHPVFGHVKIPSWAAPYA
jgi:hypothetical protein